MCFLWEKQVRENLFDQPGETLKWLALSGYGVTISHQGIS